MKLFNHDTAAAFERPSALGWLVVFVCGFLTVCIVGPLLCIAVWLFAMTLKALHVFSPPGGDVSMLSVVRVILQIAAVFGASLATVMVLQLGRRRKQERRIPGHHPTIGDFEHSPFTKTWHAQPLLPTGKSVRLSAYGASPSGAQAALWQGFMARYDELTAAAARSLLTEPHPLQACEVITLTPSGITLTRDGRMHVGFEFTTVPEDFWKSEAEEPYPTASFTAALELKSTEWLHPYG